MAARYSLLTSPVAGTTGTGLDQLVTAIGQDYGLRGATEAADILAGAAAADA